MGKEIIYDKTSEEYKAIKLLESKTTNYSDDSLILHYNTILYNLIINLMKESKNQKEIIDKANRKLDCIFANGDNENILDDLLILNKILQDKEK